MDVSKQSVESVAGISASTAVTSGITETLSSLVSRVNFDNEGFEAPSEMVSYIEELNDGS